MIDVRGYSCPIPVVEVQKEVKKNHLDSLEVLVDDPCAVDNIERYAHNNGYQFKTEELGNEWKIILTK